MSDGTTPDGITKRQLLKGASTVAAATAGLSGTGAARTAQVTDATAVDTATVRRAVETHATAAIARLVSEGVIAADAIVPDSLERVSIATAIEQRRGAAAVDIDGSARWIVVPRSTAKADVLLTVNPETGAAAATVSTDNQTTTYLIADDQVTTVDTMQADLCGEACTTVACESGPIPRPFGIEIRRTGAQVGNISVTTSVCVPVGITCPCF